MTAKAMAKSVENNVASLGFTTSCFCGFGSTGSAKEVEDGIRHETPICRICLMEDGKLVKPCACSGSIGYVHRDCLYRWLTVSKKGEVREECELCQNKFSSQGTMCLPLIKWTPPKTGCEVLMVSCGILGLTFSLLYVALLLDDRSFFDRVFKKHLAPEVADFAYLLLAGLLLVGIIFLSCIGLHGVFSYLWKQRVPKFVDNPLHGV
ncbi:hypothetical protein L596_016215 [Steinernema carpocapsae]|uniref:RING-CH-type domain-containing protein n=1 Tax=Steinernema carpocapsae TaxID=34508 RepID=A0A4V6A3B3_STECR|nr:hypothetical protein L596_016215 [Steinernema carpocapsae]